MKLKKFGAILLTSGLSMAAVASTAVVLTSCKPEDTTKPEANDKPNSGTGSTTETPSEQGQSGSQSSGTSDKEEGQSSSQSGSGTDDKDDTVIPKPENPSKDEPKLTKEEAQAQADKTTTFAGAIALVNKFVKDNYTFEQFQTDLNKFAEKLSSESNGGSVNGRSSKTVVSFTDVEKGTQSGTVSFTRTDSKTLKESDPNETTVNVCTCKCLNFNVTPVLVKNADSTLSLAFYLPKPTITENKDKPEPDHPTKLDTIEAQNNAIVTGSTTQEDGTVVESPQRDFGWNITENNKINQNKIYVLESPSNSSNFVGQNSFISTTLTLTFSHISDIETNMDKGDTGPVVDNSKPGDAGKEKEEIVVQLIAK